MRLSGFVCVLVFAGAACNISVARSEDCKCSGAPIGTPYSGGDGQPLKWLYSPSVVSSPAPPGQKIICYLKQVDNPSSTDVRDARWEVASFFRRIVPKGTSPASCPEVAGDTKPTPTNGPLNYGPSSEAYDTTVLQPKDGWGQTASNSIGESSGPGAARVADGQVNTELTFYIDDQQGKPVSAHLSLASIAKSDKGKTYFTYSVVNNSEAPLAVLVNLSATSAILEKVPILQRPFWLKPGERRAFDGSTEGRNSLERAAIVVYDLNKKISAIDSAAFYTVPGRKEVPDEAFWQQLR
jgi:hypothetical protein